MYDVPRSLQSWVSTIQTVVLTADVFQLFIKCTSMLSSIYRKHSTAQSALHMQSKYVPVRARQRKPVDKSCQTQCIIQHSYSSLCSLNERRSRNVSGLQKYRTPYKVGVMRRNVFPISTRYSTALSLRPSCMYFVYKCMRRPGCFLEHVALRICKSSVCT